MMMGRFEDPGGQGGGVGRTVRAAGAGLRTMGAEAKAKKKVAPAAFFDLDRTILDVNSGRLYVRNERRLGRISAWQLAESFFWFAMYHLSLLDVEKAYNRALRHYRGLPSELLRERTADWFGREVVERVQPGAVSAFDWHRRQGHPLVLLTSSSCYLAELFADKAELDDWLANRFVVDGAGLLTGEYESPLCFGPGKVVWAERWAEKRCVELRDSYFYTDSLSDLPMLERVGHPRVVNPDPRLRRTALKRGWPILDWSLAGGDASGEETVFEEKTTTLENYP